MSQSMRFFAFIPKRHAQCWDEPAYLSGRQDTCCSVMQRREQIKAHLKLPLDSCANMLNSLHAGKLFIFFFLLSADFFQTILSGSTIIVPNVLNAWDDVWLVMDILIIRFINQKI